MTYASIERDVRAYGRRLAIEERLAEVLASVRATETFEPIDAPVQLKDTVATPVERVGTAPQCPVGTLEARDAKHWIRDESTTGTRYAGVNYYFDGSGGRVKRSGYARWGVKG